MSYSSAIPSISSAPCHGSEAQTQISPGMVGVLSLPPGFRFHPKDEELLSFYLKPKIFGLNNYTTPEELIPLVDIYKHEPWDLPAKCRIPTRDSQWHFFAMKDRKYPNGVRSNRATEAGYWKSTGKDRKVKDINKLEVGSKKTLVFHNGRPPSGKRTDWIMHEYYIDENEFKAASGMKDIYVICRITKRNDRNEQKISSSDGEKFTKTEVDFPDQPEVVTETVVCRESSSSDTDVDAWLAEPSDPEFGIPSGGELKPQMETQISSSMETLDASSLPPGFGFHPKDEELFSFYLKPKIFGSNNNSTHEELIPVVDIYKHEPWDLPEKCRIPTRDSQWYFFALKDRKYPNGIRSNRTTEAGYWKSTGKDREVKDNNNLKIGSKKILVFHEGRPPRGKRTDWIMHEYYLDENEFKAAFGLTDIYVLCQITKRTGCMSEDRKGQKVSSNDGAKRAKTEVDSRDQPEVVAGTVISKESLSSDTDVDAWFAEHSDPEFGIPSGGEFEPQMEVDIIPVAEQPAPLDSYLDQGAVGGSEFLLEEDCRCILQSPSIDFTPAVDSLMYFSDVFKSDIDIDSWPQFPPELLDDDISSYAGYVREETHEKSSTSGADSFENADALIQIRPSRQASPFAQASPRFRLKTNRMKSRNSESVNHMFEFAKEKRRVALSEVDVSPGHVHSSKSISDTLCSTETELPSKCAPVATIIPKSHGVLPNASRRQGGERGMSQRGLRSAGLNCLVVGACIVCIAAPILYFMMRDARRFLANSASVGF